MHCGVFSSIPGLNLPDASSNSPWAVTNKNVSRYHHVSPEGDKSSLVGNRVSEVVNKKNNTLLQGGVTAGRFLCWVRT